MTDAEMIEVRKFAVETALELLTMQGDSPPSTDTVFHMADLIVNYIVGGGRPN